MHSQLIENYRSIIKKQYDKRHKKNTQYKEGDLVLVRVTQFKPGTNIKLAPKYKGPYRVKAVLNKNRYAIADVPGYNVTQKPLDTIMSPDKLKPWIRINQNTNQSSNSNSSTESEDEELSNNQSNQSNQSNLLN